MNKFINISFYIFLSMSNFSFSNYDLSISQVDFYNKHGYLIIRNCFSGNTLNELNQVVNQSIQDAFKSPLKELFSPFSHIDSEGSIYVFGDKKSVIARIVWVGAKYPKLLTLGRSHQLTIPVSQILESTSFNHLINQIHPKLPDDNVEFIVHRDIDNRRKFDPEWHDVNGKGSFVQTLTALDEMTIESGTIWFYPKSHTDDRPVKTNLSLAQEYLSGKKGEPVPLLLNPGDVLFMHPYLVHYSEKNTTHLSRRVFINGFSSPGANHQPYPGKGSGQLISI